MSKKENFDYPQIDLKKTGEWLRTLCKHCGYSVKDIQEYLHISSNQAIYEWFNGHTLPSVNNLLALSMLLKVPMNQLLVDDVHDAIYKRKDETYAEGTYERCLAYILQMSNYITRMEKHGA